MNFLDHLRATIENQSTDYDFVIDLGLVGEAADLLEEIESWLRDALSRNQIVHEEDRKTARSFIFQMNREVR